MTEATLQVNNLQKMIESRKRLNFISEDVAAAFFPTKDETPAATMSAMIFRRARTIFERETELGQFEVHFRVRDHLEFWYIMTTNQNVENSFEGE